MTATRILSFALASVSVSAVSVAEAVPQGVHRFEPARRLLLIPSMAAGGALKSHRVGCDSLWADAIPASGGFVMGTGTANPSNDARLGEIGEAPGNQFPAVAGASLRIIPRSGLF